jgi:hypothetical protein
MSYLLKCRLDDITPSSNPILCRKHNNLLHLAHRLWTSFFTVQFLDCTWGVLRGMESPTCDTCEAILSFNCLSFLHGAMPTCLLRFFFILYDAYANKPKQYRTKQNINVRIIILHLDNDYQFIVYFSRFLCVYPQTLLLSLNEMILYTAVCCWELEVQQRNDH